MSETIISKSITVKDEETKEDKTIELYSDNISNNETLIVETNWINNLQTNNLKLNNVDIEIQYQEDTINIILDQDTIIKLKDINNNDWTDIENIIDEDIDWSKVITKDISQTIINEIKNIGQMATDYNTAVDNKINAAWSKI